MLIRAHTIPPTFHTRPNGGSATSTFTLAAGTHTVGVVGGVWGDVRFAEVDIVKHGATDTLKLKAPDAVPVLVTPGAVGVVWVASAFKYVNLGTNGAITFTVKPKVAGNYHLVDQRRRSGRSWQRH